MSNKFKEDDLKNIACHFCKINEINNIIELKSGNINSTFFVKLNKNCSRSDFILQYINIYAFRDFENITHNYSILTKHIEHNIFSSSNQLIYNNFTFARLIPSNLTSNYIVNYKDSFWRAITYINNSTTLHSLSNASQAFELGLALSKFHLVTSNIDKSILFDSIADFHNTSKYLAKLNSSIGKCRSFNNYSLISSKLFSKTIDLFYSLKFDYREILKAESQRKLSKYPTHGDPKITNFLFDINQEKVKALIDYDTFQNGLYIIDIADLLRSCCNLIDEDSSDFDSVDFDLSYFKASLEGYFTISNPLFTYSDFVYLPQAILQLPYELGVRFLNDYINGDKYFITTYPSQNLHRALIQFNLFVSIKSKLNNILNVIKKFNESI